MEWYISAEIIPPAIAYGGGAGLTLMTVAAATAVALIGIAIRGSIMTAVAQSHLARLRVIDGGKELSRHAA